MIAPERLAADAAECKPQPTDAQLNSVVGWGLKYLRFVGHVADLERDLTFAKSELAKIAEVYLPEAMHAVGMSEFKLEDGSRITVAQEYYANIPEPSTKKPELMERRNAAFQWLRDNKHGPLIKTEITVQAGRGEQDRADNVIRALQQMGVPYTSTDAVHWATLRALVKEQYEKGTPLPEATFGIHVKQVASVEPPNK